MNRRVAIWTLLLLAGAAGSAGAQRGADAAPKPESYAGTWTGTWDGAGSGGGFDLTLEQPKEGPMIGKVSVTGEPAYKATLKSLAFDGKKMTGKYDFPADESAEVTLIATFEGNKATGTWSLAAKGAGAEVAGGTWTVARK
jgi:hypothetical protein